MSWLSIDISNSTKPLPQTLASGIGDTPFFDYSALDLLGLGFVMAAIVVVAVIACVAANARRASVWMIVSSLLFAAAMALSGVVVGLLMITKSAYQWILPDDWSAYSPQVAVGVAGIGFSLTNLALASFSLWLWTRMRSLQKVHG